MASSYPAWRLVCPRTLGMRGQEFTLMPGSWSRTRALIFLVWSHCFRHIDGEAVCYQSIPLSEHGFEQVDHTLRVIGN